MMGEVPSARKRLADSDRSVGELAQQWRQLQNQREGAANKGVDRN
jgi:hypothetical protein